MNRIIIVGTDTPTGYSLKQFLQQNYDVTGLTLAGSDVASPEAVTTENLEAAAEDHDVLIFCGGGSVSSWHPQFGCLDTEREWLDHCVDLCDDRNSTLAYISSDAVFCGPRIFHDDDSDCYSEMDLAVALRGCEQQAAQLRRSLVVRTNVIDGLGDTSFCDHVLDLLDDVRPQQVDASTYGTPIAACSFAEAVEHLLAEGVCGTVNVGGSERTSPYQFAVALANFCSYSADRLDPLVSLTTVERSLRSERLRVEAGFTTPVLRETVELVELPERVQRSIAA